MYKILLFSTLALAAFYACDRTPWGTKVSGNAKVEAGAQSFSGRAELRNTSYKKLSISGSGTLDSVTVDGPLNSNGSLYVSKSTIESLKSNGSSKLFESKIGSITANGNVTLEKTTVSGISTINGSLNAKASHLGEITASSRKITLSNSQTKTIHVKKTSDPGQQMVVLNNTSVNGDVIFESGNGKVVLQGHSKITGKVIGGETK